mmetsp:Transcript_25929/g.43615  ORF Transcript_25929/g.43615 Transcript_25929/m.43615 type:complete len:215 (+) Transcript_25929:64-708(+)
MISSAQNFMHGDGNVIASGRNKAASTVPVNGPIMAQAIRMSALNMPNLDAMSVSSVSEANIDDFDFDFDIIGTTGGATPGSTFAEQTPREEPLFPYNSENFAQNRSERGLSDGRRNYSMNNRIDYVDKDEPDAKKYRSDEEQQQQQQRQLTAIAKVPKNDIRRHYARMFMNTLNAGDLGITQKYFSTFMRGNCQFVETSAYNPVIGTCCAVVNH